MKFVQVVIGPAGVGKSTYCKTIQEHCRLTRRSMHVANLDPAAEHYGYDALFDVRDLINLDDVMAETGLGPNGGLVYCMEHLLQNLDWLRDEIENMGEDDYVLLDCPGQIELYSHLPIMRSIVQAMVNWGYRVMSVYLLDALFVMEPPKFISGCMLSLSCMIHLELPHMNIITKCDLADKDTVDRVLDSEGTRTILGLDRFCAAPLRGFMSAVSGVVDDYMMVSFATLDSTDEESIEGVIEKVDFVIQYGEDAEVRVGGELVDEYDRDEVDG